MEELKFIGAEDGFVIVTTESGMQYRLPVSDELRSAIVDSSRHIEHSDNLPRPREVQAQLRSGATVQQVADQYHVDEHYIARFAAPVFAELAHMVDLAKGIAVDPIEEDGPDTFGALVSKKLQDAEAQHETWTAWREQDHRWIVQVEYLLATMEHDCRWELDPRHRQLTPLNQAAQTLSGDEPLTPAHARQLHPVAPMFTSYTDAEDDAQDQDAEDDTSSPSASSHAPAASPGRTQHIDNEAKERRQTEANRSGANVTQIGEAMKHRDDATQTLLDRLDRQRGQRQGPPTEDSAEDQLTSRERDPSGPLPLAQIKRQLAKQSDRSPEAQPQSSGTHAPQQDEHDKACTSHPAPADDAQSKKESDSTAAHRSTSSPSSDDQPVEHTPTDEPNLLSGLESIPELEPHKSADDKQRDHRSQERPRSSKRRAMPSWDEIVFGSHSEHD